MSKPLVLAGVDPFSRPEALDALRLADRIAAALGASLHAVHVFTPDGADVTALRRHHEQELRRLLEHAGVDGTATAVADASPAFVLHNLADRQQAACVVIGSGQGGFRGCTSLGPVAAALLHGSRVPVALAPREYRPPATISRVGAAVAGTPESDTAVQRAVALGSVVTLIAGEEFGCPPAAARLERAARTAGENAVGMIVEGDTAQALADTAGTLDLDLLVTGSRSYGPLRAVLLGRVTRRLLELAPCPVMVVPRLPDPAHEAVLVGGMEAALEP
jgi:nucleotide-binding universal stress UspA family protein